MKLKNGNKHDAKRQHLIDEMKLAYDIHKQWAQYQKERKSNNKKLSPNAGDDKWHRRWMRTYKDVIRELKSLDT